MSLESLEQKIRELRSLQREAGGLIEAHAQEIRHGVLWRQRGAKSFQDYLKTNLGFSHFEARELLSAIGVILTSNQLRSEDPIVQARIDLLRMWRRLKSKDAGFAPFRIFSNRTLLAIANDNPQDQDGLLKIPGMGTKKFQTFGDELLLAIKMGRLPIDVMASPAAMPPSVSAAIQ